MIMFQYRYFLHLYFVLIIIFPILMPMYFWNETLWSSFFAAYAFPYTAILHATWSINSFCHLWGSKPYDKRVRATQSLVATILNGGDGWHNYHHAFPWDCRWSEYGKRDIFGTILLDIYAFLGLAYDLKSASPKVIYEHMKKHGDGSRTANLTQYEERKAKEKTKEVTKDIFNKLQ